MARQLAALVVLGFATALVAQDRPPVDPTATPAPTKAPGSPGMRRPGPGFPSGPDAEKARQGFQQMSPEQRQRWMETMKQLSELPPERKMEIFQRAEFFRKKMREDVEAAIKRSGLSLSDEQKKKFSDRYFEERKHLEEDLRKQMEELRRPKLEALVEKLKHEFAEP